MKINAINVSNMSKRQNFKGFHKTVTEVKNNTHYDLFLEADTGEYETKKTVYYYPFANESQQEIQDFIRDNTYSKITNGLAVGDQIKYIEKSKVILQSPLSMSKSDYNNYINSMVRAKEKYEKKMEKMRRADILQYAPIKAEVIEDELMDNGLNDYIAKV